MTPKDVDITIIALLKSTIEAQTPREEWEEALEQAIGLFKRARAVWVGSDPSVAAAVPSTVASSEPSSGMVSGDPSPRPSSGLPVYVVTDAPDPGVTKNGKQFRTLTLRNDQGTSERVGFFESKWETFDQIARAKVGDQVTAVIEVKGEYTNGNKLRIVKVGTANTNW
tara:strand:+ start:123 stop:626 length:504 start_codon:yes stop_codon:yes gene_type:complete